MKSMEEIIQAAGEGEPARLVVAGAGGREVLKSVAEAQRQGMVKPLLIGETQKIRALARELELNISPGQIIAGKSDREISEVAVEKLLEDQDILMKGLVETSSLMKAVLAAKDRLLKRRLISHLVLAEVPALDRLLFISDGGVNIKPGIEERAEIIQNAIDAARQLGWERPRVALMAAVEKVKSSMPATEEAAILSKMADRGQISGGVVEGPLALDNALFQDAAGIKGLTGEVAGQADILITPDIVSGNLLGKSVVYLAGGCFAAFIGGTTRPIIVTSRADKAETRLASLAVAVLMSD